MINMGELFSYPRIRNPEMERVTLTDNERKNFMLKPMDLLFARQSLVREGAGKCSIVMETPEPTCFESHLIRVRLDKNTVNPMWYFYYFMSYDGMGNVRTLVMDVAAAGIRGSELAKLKVPKPPKEIQDKIASILSNYDELIENNSKRIALLTLMSKTIFEEWFVNFLYPGHEENNMIESELGPIPKGWELLKIEDVLNELESGSRPKGGIDSNETAIPSIGAENILGLGIYDYSKDKFVTEEFFNGMRQGKVKSGDVLLYKDGAKVGRKSMFRDGFPHVKCCINEHVFILRSNEKCSQEFLYLWFDQQWMTEKIKGLNANAAQPGINRPGVKSLPILIPADNVIKEFNIFADEIFSEIFNLAKKNNILRQTRDLLIPKLISGELDVSELEIEMPEEAS